MAYDNTEIEIKLKLDGGQVESVVSALKKVASFVQESKQKDTYFVPGGDNFLNEKYPYKWLSVRERGDKKILNFKHFYPEKAEQHQYCKEYEVNVDSVDNLALIFAEMGINRAVAVEKTRAVYKYKNEYEITIDDVVGLGSFMEIEATRDMGTPEKVKEEMFSFARSLGVGDLNVDYRGYPFLLLEKDAVK